METFHIKISSQLVLEDSMTHSQLLTHGVYCTFMRVMPSAFLRTCPVISSQTLWMNWWGMTKTSKSASCTASRRFGIATCVVMGEKGCITLQNLHYTQVLSDKSRITKSISLEKTSQIIESSLGRNSSLDHGTECHIQSFLKHIQGWWHHHFSEHPILMFSHSSCEDMPPNVQTESPQFDLELEPQFNLMLNATNYFHFITENKQ